MLLIIIFHSHSGYEQAVLRTIAITRHIHHLIIIRTYVRVKRDVLRLYKIEQICDNKFMLTPHEFLTWLDQQLAQRGWSDHYLARRAGLSHSVLSKARNGTPPRWEACEALARALDLPPETVFRQAGLLEPLPAEQADLEAWRYLLGRLSARDRYELLQIARMKVALQAKAELQNG